MANVTEAQWKLDIDRDINTNGQQRITGLIMNNRLTDLKDSVIWGEVRRGRHEQVSAAGTRINFNPAMRTTNYTLIVRCYNAAGESTGYEIPPTQQTVSGFQVIPAQDGFLDYLAIE